MEDTLIPLSQHKGHQGAPLRIFLVEDSEDVRDLIVENLAEIPGVVLSGYAETEDEALRHLLEVSYDVLILDIQLRQGNGLSLLQSLTRSNTRPQREAKIIFSNHAGATYRRVGKQYGVDHFFDKSSELALLCDLLEKMSSEDRSDGAYKAIDAPNSAQPGGL
ncbi:response regulator [Herbaspirillum lusitanum]|uniref:Response regulator n=1 Tax=Herbaspirillum lusitanum TaxID=213312 RepID=A0ABW9A3J0_9BURK